MKPTKKSRAKLKPGEAKMGVGMDPKDQVKKFRNPKTKEK